MSKSRTTALVDVKQVKTVGWASIGTVSLAAFTYALYGLISLPAAVMCAIAVVSAAFVSWAVGANTKKRRSASWMIRKFGGVLSPRRRVRSWWYGKHRNFYPQIRPMRGQRR